MDAKKWFRKHLGIEIRERRVELEKTLDNLAYQTGIDSKHLGKIENGIKLPNSFTLGKIDAVLDLDLDQFRRTFKQKFFLEDNVYKNAPE